MNDTTTTDDPGAAEPEADDSAGSEVEPTATAPPAHTAPRDDAFRTRFLLPLLIPLGSMLVVAILVLNISRLFLAGSETSALVLATIITISILVIATLISFHGRLRSTTLALLLAMVVVIVIATGLTTIGPSIKTGQSANAALPQPKGPAVSQVNVVAEPSIKFNATAFTATAGIVQFNYSGAPGHTLQIQEIDSQGFPLGTLSGFPKSGKVTLKPGTYTIFCTIDNHRQEGMQATVTVTAG
jgi:plastocyanin